MKNKTYSKSIIFGAVLLLCAGFLIYSSPPPLFAAENILTDDMKGKSGSNIRLDEGVVDTPYGGIGRYGNLLTYSEAFNDSSWIKDAGITLVTTDDASILAPDGTATAEKLTFTGASSHLHKDSILTGANTASKTFTFSIWLRTNSGTVGEAILVRRNDGSDSALQNVTLTTNWQRFSVTRTFDATTTSGLRVDVRDLASGTVYCWGAQVEEASTHGVYIKTTSTVITASRGIVANANLVQGGNLTLGGNLYVTGSGPHYFSNGSVGIGTTNPTSGQNLEIYAGGSSVAQVYLNAADGGIISLRDWGDTNQVLQLYSRDGYGGFYITNDNLGTINKYPLIINKSTGNVGIGTAGPGAKLDVYGNQNISNSGVLTFSTSSGYNAINMNNDNIINANLFTFNDPGVSEGLSWTGSAWSIDVSPLDRSNADGNLNLYGTANNIALWRPALWVYNAANYTTATAQSNGGLNFTTTGTGHVTFNPGGNVGIGTTLPGTKLDVIDGAIRTNNQLISTIATGTAPLAVSSTTVVTNLNADLLDGAQASMTAGNSTIVQRNASGYVYANYFNTTADVTAAAASHFAIQTGTDSFIRWQTPANVRTSLGLVIGTNVQAYDADLDDLADGSLSGSKVGTGISATNVTTGTLPNTVLDADLQDLADGSLSGSLIGSGISATNITTGTLGTDRYSAYSDLQAENYLGDNADTDLTSKLYVDNAIAGLKWKQSVRISTTTAGTLATSFANGQTVDGVALVTGNRILIKDQSTGSENGIYTVNASGAPTRAADADISSELLQTAVFIEEGTTNADTAWVCNTNAPITLNTTALTFTQFTGAAAYVWGNGLSNSGNTINVLAGIGIDVDDTYVIHEDLSTQASVDNSNGTVIQDVTMDTLGHVTGLASVDLDGRYVDVSGDTMTGSLNIITSAGDNPIDMNFKAGGVAQPWRLIFPSSVNGGGLGAGANNFGIYNATAGEYLLTLKTDKSIQFGSGTISSSGNLAVTGSSASYFNGGNVGIGTTIPAYKLEVIDDISAPIFRDRNNPTTYYVDPSGTSVVNTINPAQIGGHTVSGTLNMGNQAITGVYSIEQYTSSNWKLDNTGKAYFAGNVGIGTTNPSTHKLMVSGSVQVGTAFNYTPTAGTIDLSVGSPTANSRFLFGQSNDAYGGLTWNYNATTASAYMTLFSGNSNNNVMSFLQNGNVGIGTTAPTSPLHIGKAVSGSTEMLRIEDTVNDRGDWKLLMNSNKGLYLQPNETDGSSAFFSIRSASDVPRFYVNTDTGNVGMGTTNPLATLDISGTFGSNLFNLLPNSDFESWLAGASSAPDGWTKSGTMAQDGTNYYHGAYGAALSGAPGTVTLTYTLTAQQVADLKGKTITFSVYAKTTAADAFTRIWSDGTGGTSTMTGVTNDGNWNRITSKVTFPSDMTSAYVRVEAQAAGTVYIDEAMLVEGTMVPKFIAKTITDSGSQSIFGNVGIGTTAPGQKLQVVGTIESTSGGFKFPDGTTQTSANTSGGWTDGGTNVYTTTTTDNVGIGTTGPGAKLDIYESITSVPLNSVLKVEGYANAVEEGPFIDFHERWTGAYPNWIVGRIGAIYETVSAGNNMGALVFHTANTSDANQGTSAVSEKMRILGNGNVGIGTTAPGAKLVVRDATNDVAIKVQSPASDVTKFAEIYLGTDNDVSRLQLRANSNTGAGHIGNPSGYPLYFFANGIANTAMTILSSGNVGIGTTEPTSPLYVVRAFTGNGTFTGLQSVVTHGTATTSNYLRGIYGEATAGSWLGPDYTYGVYGKGIGGTSASQGAVGTAYGVYGVAVASTAPSGAQTAIGGYFTASGGDSNYAAIFEAGNVGIGSTGPGARLDVAGGAIRTNNQLISTIGTGTAPLAVSSTTVVSNLNADLLDDQHGSYYAPASWVGSNDIKAVGNFGQWYNHGTYTDANTNMSKWGWNYLQGATNAPNATSSQWYRFVGALGADYPNLQGAGAYRLELVFPRYSHADAGVYMRTMENGTIGSWTQIGSKIAGSPVWTQASLTNLNQLTNGPGYITDGNTNWDNSYGYITAGSTITGLIQSTAAGTSYFTGGNVGIGTTGPGAKLEVAGAFLVSGGSTASFQGIVNLGNGNDNVIVNNSHLYVVGSSGNVGIGTTGPTEKLDVVGNLKITGSLKGSITQSSTNIIPNSDFEIDTNGSGIPDRWSSYAGGSGFYGSPSLDAASYISGGHSSKFLPGWEWARGGVLLPENASYYATKIFTISYWAKVNPLVGSPTIYAGFTRAPGTYSDWDGGSVGGSLTATWQKFTGTVTIPAGISGSFYFVFFPVESTYMPDNTWPTGMYVYLDSVMITEGYLTMPYTEKPLEDNGAINVLKTSGNVGIGTTNPGSYKLAVYGNTYFEGGANFTGGSLQSDILLAGYSRPNKIQIDAESGYAKISTAGTAADVNLSIIPKGAGNVGIGSTLPGATLDVVGSIRATGNITSTGGGIGGWSTETGKVYVTNTSDNVGIGTTEPDSYKLNVNGSIAIGAATTTDEQAILVRNDGPGSFAVYKDDQASNYNVADNGYVVEVGTRGGSPYKSLETRGQTVFATQIGNVGIGTTSPTAKLAISGGGIKLNTAGTGLGTGGLNIENATSFSAKNSTDTYEEFLWPRWSDNIMYINYGASGFNIRNNSSVSTMFMQNGGNVGIGPTSPGELLHVRKDQDSDTRVKLENLTAGASAFAGFQVGSNAATGELQSVSASYTGAPDLADYVRLFADSDATGLILHSKAGAGSIQFWVGNSDARNVVERARINSAGNVGIGTTSPTALLDVNGNIRGNFLSLGTNSAIDFAKIYVPSGYLAIGNGDLGAPTAIRFRNAADAGTAITGASIYEANNDILYVQFGNANRIIFRDKNGADIAGIDSSFNISNKGYMYPGTGSASQSSYYLYQSASGLRTNGQFYSDGNVGIGTTAPNNNKLDVLGVSIRSKATATNKGLLIVEGGSGRTSDDAEIDLRTDGGTVLGNIEGVHANAGWGGHTLVLGAGGNRYLYIQNGGNVGIGTTGPTERLEVSGGNLKVGGNITATGSISGTFANLITSGNLQVTGTGPHYISQGNVGIGTTVPNSKLNVYSTFSGAPTGTVYGSYYDMNLSNVTNTDKVGLYSGIRGTVGYTGTVTAIYGELATSGAQNNGNVAVYGYAHAASAEGNYGVRGYATGGGYTNIGVKAEASGTGPMNGGYVPSSLNGNYAIWAKSDTTGPYNVGIYATASGGSTANYAGIFDAGNVGIGTTGPAQKLHVNGNILMTSGNYFTGTSNYIGLLGGNTTDDTTYEWAGFYSGATRQGIILYDGAWTGANNMANEFSITAENSNHLTLNTGANYHILLMPKGTGNVGIGTTAPGSKLHIVGQTRISGSNPARLTIEPEGATTNLWNFDNSAGTLRIFREDYASSGTGINGSVKMAIQNDGNVGIGLTSPAALLHIVKDDSSTNTQIELARIGRSTTGTAATNIGAYTSTFLEDTGGSMVEAGRAGFLLRNATAGANTAGEFSVKVERETYSDMVEALTVYADGGTKWICGNSSRDNGPDGFGYTIGSANTMNWQFDGTNRVQFDWTSPNASIRTLTGANLQFTTLGSGDTISFDQGNNGANIFINTSGNVGIGTISPIGTLDIANNTSNAFKAGTYFNIVSNNGTWLTHNAYYNGSVWVRIEDGNKKPAGIHLEVGKVSFIYDTATTGVPSFNTSMTIDNAGNVGIGTTGPGFKLDVQGDVGLGGGKAVYNTVAGSSAGGLRVEEATTNLVTNPSFEVNLTGQSYSQNASCSRSSEQAYYGSYSDKAVSSAVGGVLIGQTTGEYLSVSPSTQYSASFWIYTATGSRTADVYLIEFTAAGAFIQENGGGFLTIPASTWTRVTRTFTTTATTGKVSIRPRWDAGAASQIVYFDGIQLEQKAYATTYTDGSLGTGYSWSGTAHDSTSTRTAGVVVADQAIMAAGINSRTDLQVKGLTLSGGQLTDTSGAVTIGSNLRVTGAGPHYISAGNVGIGMVAPLAKLHAGIGVSDTSTYSFANTGAVITSVGVDHTAARTNALALMRDGTGGVVYAGLAAFDLSRWQADGTNARTQLDIRLADTDTNTLTNVLSLRSNGNVGIGTTVPGEKLHVVGSLKMVSDSDVTTTLGSGIIYTQNTGGTVGLHIDTNEIQTVGDALYFQNDNAQATHINNLIHVTTAGNVGIGTTGPGANLDVQATSGIKIFNTNLNYGNGVTGSYVANYMTAAYGTSSTGAITGLRIDTTNAGSGATYGLLVNGGNVGIGTTVPGTKLDVEGDVTLNNLLIGSYGRMLRSADEWLRINDDDLGGDYHTSGIYLDGPGVGIQNGLAIGGSNYPSSGLIINSGGLVVSNGVANGRGTYGEGTLNLDLLSSAANGTGVSGINFRSGGNHPSDGAQIYFESDRNRTSGAEMSRLVIRTENDASGSVMDGILIRGGDVVIDTGQTVDGVVPNPAFELKIDGTTKMSMNNTGDITFTGYLTKSGGGFTIDHPLDPANKILTHSFVESPDMKNLYDGVVILGENGESTIELPDWFEALNKDFRYQLTTIGKPGMPYVKEEIKDNKFTIAGDPGMKVSWQVTGTRKDAWAEKYRIKVEEEKGSRDGLVKKGEYIAKDCFEEKK